MSCPEQFFFSSTLPKSNEAEIGGREHFRRLVCLRYHALVASQNIPTPIDSLQGNSFQYIRLNEFPMSVCDLAIILDSCGQCLEGGLVRLLGLITVVIPLDRFVARELIPETHLCQCHYRDFLIMDISSGVSSYFNNTEIEAWSYMGCLEYLAKVSKDKALRMDDPAKRSFQCIEVTSFFKRLDTQSCICHQKSRERKRKLYESKLKACAYDRFVENTDMKNDRSSKCLRQETIISEEDEKQPDANTVSKADDDNFEEEKDDDEDQDAETVEEESYSSNYVSFSHMCIFSESYSQQASSDSSSLLSVLKKYCANKSTSLYDPAHSFIVDLSLSSKIRGQFSNEEWAKLVKRRPDVVQKSYYHEIESLISHLFGQKMDLLQARKQWYELRNLVAPKYNLIQRMTEKNLDAFESLRNPLQNDCHEREWTACGEPYSYDLTKLASDEFNLSRIMKDMLDDLELKLLKAGKD
ncbi:22526_t:CDS:10 [Cetraspora pellucida]|uniref:22526_t:CDS:1 n=1 Tax=Cetraspora pellucida TaxID=1433469 RepID=A0A9N9HIL2_9GLOM|nr:22526_t:CDS:10 [Cetraspora pellucida]